MIGGGVFNAFETYALHVEFHDFTGGPQALAASVMAAAEAMRPLRWPAERLDTLGGYLTYHNILLFQGFLAIYAAVQGVHLIRRPEDHHALEQLLTTGWSRVAYARDRIIAFILALALISLGLGASVALSLAWVGEPDTSGSLISLAAVGMCSIVAFGGGLFAAQVVRSTRSGIGVAVIGLVIVYIVTNEWENLGPLGLLRFVSPFHFANSSRALVPGVGWSAVDLTVLASMAVALLAAGVAAFVHRDYGGAIFTRPVTPDVPAREVRAQRWWLGSIWRAQLVRHRIVLLAWALCTAAFSVLWTGLASTVSESWAMSDFFTQFLGAAAGTSMTAMYISFGCDTVAAIVLAYAVSNASGWVADLHEGRVEALLAAPLSWRRLMFERLVAACVGVVLVTMSWLVIGAGFGVFVDASMDLAGSARTLLLCLLLGWAGAALAAVLAVLTRNTWATTGLIVYIVVAYVLGWFVNVLHWPVWLRRLSVFEAYGHPYREWPPTSNVVILVGIGIVGAAIAGALAERTPKVPG